MARKKLSPLLLLPEDEFALQAAIVDRHPEVRFVDDSGPWPDPGSPPVLESVTAARSFVAIWPTSLRPEFPTEIRSNGDVRCAATGCAVTWERSSRIKIEGGLHTGMWSAVIEPDMEKFVSSIWRILFRCTTNDLVRHHRPTGEYVRMPTYRIGPHALGEARAGRLALMDNALVLHPPAG